MFKLIIDNISDFLSINDLVYNQAKVTEINKLIYNHSGPGGTLKVIA